MHSPAVTIVRTAKRHPRATLSIAAFAGRRRRRTAKAVRLARETVDVYARISDPAVQKELRAAAASFAQAVGRAQELGLGAAPGDRKLVRHSGAGLEHLSKALAHARNRRQTRLRRLGLAVGLSTVGAYGLWRLREANGA
jgi:hypothetical protein